MTDLQRLDSLTLRAIESRVLPTLVVAGATLLTTSCTSKKQEATEKLDKAIKKCRAADGPIYKAPTMGGEDEEAVLRRTCDEDQGDVEMVDAFTAQVEVGPYNWEAGRNQEIGIWQMKAVTWEPLDTARRLLDGDPGPKKLDRAIENLRKAQSEYGKSPWIRLELMDALLRREAAERTSEKSALEWSDAVEKHFDETVEWAQENDDRATEVRARLRLVDYIQGFIDQVRQDKRALESKDFVHLERSIKVAEEAGNDEKAEKYRTELEKQKEKRPRKKKRYTELIDAAQSNLCGRLAHLQTDGIEDEKLRKRVASAKGGINCRKLLEEDAGDGEGE
jgi:hypothetical protein